MKIWIILILFLFTPLFTFAQSSHLEITPNGRLTLSFQNINLSQPTTPASTFLVVYQNTHPATTTNRGGVSSSGSSQPLIDTFISPWFNVYATSSNSITVDIETTYGATHGDGNYWISANAGTESEQWYQLTRTSGQWSTDYVPPPFWINIGLYNTRFTDISITGSSTSLNINVEHYIDPSEINTNNSQTNPTNITFSYSLRPGTTISSQSENISSTTGTSTTNTQLPSLTDGTYDLRVKFSNLVCILTDENCPFPESYLYTSFTLSGGILTATGTPEYYTPQRLSTDFNRYSDCSLIPFELLGCLNNAVIFLFVPQQSVIDSMLAQTIEADIEFVNVAYTAFDSIASFTTTASSSISNPGYELAIYLPEIGTTTLWSFSLMTDNLGSAGTIFRLIASLVLYMGFTYMVINSINNAISFVVRDDQRNVHRI